MADLTKTRRQLIDQALYNLHVLEIGQSPSSEDVAKVDNLVDATIAELNGKEIIYIDDVGDAGPSGGAIDPAVFLALADYLAWKAGPSFALASDPALTTLAKLAESTLETIARPARTRRTLKVDSALARPRLPFSFTNG
jgi:hypothetical protein